MQPRILFCVFFLSLLTSINTCAQGWQWAKRIGGHFSNANYSSFGLTNGQHTKDAVCDNKGNLYVLSFTHDSLLEADGVPLSGWGKRDNVLSSFDCSGRHRWSKVIGTTTDSEWTCSIRTDHLGNVYAFGKLALTQGGHLGNDSTLAYSPKSIFLVKWDSAGRFQWLRMPQPDTISYLTSINKTAPIDMDIDEVGNIHLLCYLSRGLHGGSYAVNTAGATVLKYNGAGQLLGGLPLPIQLTGNGDSREFMAGTYGLTYSPGLGQYLLAGTARYLDNTQPQPYPSIVRIGTQAAGSGNEGRGFFAAFSAVTGNLIKLINRLPAAPASDRGIWLQCRPGIDALNNIYLAGYARDSSTFNGYRFHNPKSKGAYLPFVMKIEGVSSALRWMHYGQSTGVTSILNVPYNTVNASMPSGFFQLAMSNGKVVLTGRFADSLWFPGSTLSKPSVTDSISAFVLQLDAATGSLQRATAFGAGPASAHTLPTAIAADKRGNFYIGGWYNSNTLGFGGAPLQNPQAPLLHYDGFVTKWGITSCNCTVPAPSYTTVSVTGTSRRFTYTGTTAGIDSLVWSWGDGQSQKVTTGFANSITHIFPSATATYEVCVTAFSSSCGSNQMCTQNVPVYVGSVGLPGNAISVHPNPASGTITISGGANGHFTIRSLVGVTVYTGVLQSDAESVNIAALPVGMYLFSISNSTGSVTVLRIIKE